LLNRGKAFYKEHIYYARLKFEETTQTDVLSNVNVTDDDDDDNDDDYHDENDDDNESSCNDGSTIKEINALVDGLRYDTVPQLSFRRCQGSVIRWDFPGHISQSTIDGRNGSTACSVISVVLAVDLQKVDGIPLSDPTALCPIWYRA